MRVGAEIRQWTKEEDDIFAEMWANGKTAEEIALKIGRNRGDVFARRHLLDLPTKHEMCEQRLADPKFIASFLDLYNAGASFAKIRDVLGIRQFIIYKMIRTLNLERRNPRSNARKYQRIGKRKYSDEVIDEIKAHKENGLGIQAIADKMGIKYEAVSSICMRYKIIKGRRQFWTHEEEKEMMKMLSEGLSPQQVSEKIGRSVLSICSKCSKIGIKNQFPQLINAHAQTRGPLTIEKALRYKIAETKNRGLHEVNLTLEYLLAMYEKQNGKCFYTDVLLSTERNSLGTLSIDRIDSSRGYVEGNVVLCIWKVNLMKQILKQSEFIALCHLVSKKHPEAIVDLPQNDHSPAPVPAMSDSSQLLP